MAVNCEVGYIDLLAFYVQNSITQIEYHILWMTT